MAETESQQNIVDKCNKSYLTVHVFYCLEQNSFAAPMVEKVNLKKKKKSEVIFAHFFSI